MLLQGADTTRGYIQHRIPKRMRAVLSVEDVLQEAWIAAFRTCAGFVNESPGAFDRWFLTIVRSRLLNAIRYANQAMRTVDRLEKADRSGSYLGLVARLADPARTASSHCAGQEAVQAVRLAISALPDDYRQAITMHYIEGQSQAEVASQMNKTKPAVHGLLYRGLEQLKERMGNAERFLNPFRK